MKAVCWYGKEDVHVEEVPDPRILNPRDVIVRVTLTAICGSDLHLYGGLIPGMKSGDILGHEFMGEVVETGRQNGLKAGDRVVVPFAIACGNCFFCRRGMTSACDNSNPNYALLKKKSGYTSAGLFGYSHMYGGYAGGQAEYVRVPYGDVGPLKIPPEITDEQALFLSDILPTGFMAAENCDIRDDDTIAVWGCGPVGQFAIRSAFLLGAGRVIAIDRFPERLELARKGNAELINYEEVDDVPEMLKEMTSGIGPDACIDAVGMESHGESLIYIWERAKQATGIYPDRTVVLREAIKACRNGGTVSLPGVYAGHIDKMPMGVAFGKGLKFRMGQTHIHRYMGRLLQEIRDGRIDPASIISHRVQLDDAPQAYHMFQAKEDHCTKIVMRP
jgi:threonine dehydrogenase-like Zn-dependent dehydrogenase